jgi:hypothetical protein
VRTNKIIACLILAFVVGCVSDAPKKRPSLHQPANALSGADNPVVFEGTVLGRLESPGSRSSMQFTFYQGIRYRVDKVVSGPISRGNVVVYHLLGGQPLTDADVPELSKEIFKTGRKLRVRAEKTREGEYVVPYDDPNTVAIIK